MARRLSPQQLKIFKEIIRDKRILDVGDKTSQFLAEEFARYVKAWTVVGRKPPAFLKDFPPHVTIVEETFDLCSNRLSPSDFDVIVFPFSSPASKQDVCCLEWALAEHVILFFCHPKDDTVSGSPSFWKLIRTLTIEHEEKDFWSRLLVIQKKSSLSKTQTSSRALPKGGERYRLVRTFKWPGKKPGEKPPTVEITKNWEKGSGPAKMIATGEVIHLHTYDLASPM